MFYTSLYFLVSDAFYEHVQTLLSLSLFQLQAPFLSMLRHEFPSLFFQMLVPFMSMLRHEFPSLFFPDAGAFYEHAHMSFPLFYLLVHFYERTFIHCFLQFFPIVCNCLFYFCYLKSSLFQKYSK